MIHIGLLNIIRRMHLRQKLSIREIARLTGVSRNTVTKHLAANTIEPKFATPERQSKIDPFAGKLAGWLKTEAAKSRKRKRTVKQLHADLVALGFTGSYARVAAFARMSRARKRSGESFSRRLGRRNAIASSRRRGAGPLCRCNLIPAMPFGLTGARTLRFWAVSTRSCRWRISSCRTAGLIFCGLDLFRPTRCCLTPTGTGSGSSAVCLRGASTTVRLGRHRSEARPNEDGGGSCRPRQGAADQHALSGHDQPL